MGDLPVKVVTLGNSNVGKTALVTRWLEDRFDTAFNPTVGAGFQVQPVDYEGRAYQLQIWDTAGQDQYRNTTALYCRNVKAALLVFDVTERTSYDDLEGWISLIRDGMTTTPFVLVGNKTDLSSERRVDPDEAAMIADKYGATYLETSARTGSGVDEAFAALVRFACGGAVLKPKVTTTAQPAPKVEERGVDIKEEGNKGSHKKGCCQ